MKKIGITSGFFQPLHEGHIELFRKSREQCDKLIVIVNNDDQVKVKHGTVLYDVSTLKIIIEAIRHVDQVVTAIDKDQTVCATLVHLATKYPGDELIFFKGGDRKISDGTIPEVITCRLEGIEIVDCVVPVINSSSTLLKRFLDGQANKVDGHKGVGHGTE